MIRWIYRIFDTLFFGQITIYCLALCAPLIFSVADWYERSVTGDGQRIRYDTTFSRTIPNFTSEIRDSTGRILSKSEEEAGQLVTRDASGRGIRRQSLDSLQKAHAALDTPELERIRARQDREIDSLLKADPNVRVIRYKDGYRTSGKGTLYTGLTFPIFGTVSRAGKFPPPLWRDTLSVSPAITILQTENSSAPYTLSFQVRSWQEFQHIPVILILLGYLRLLLYIGSLLWATYLLKNLFRALTYEVYFSKLIWKRCQAVGWIFVGLFVSYNLTLNLSHAATWRYLAAHGFHEDWQQPFLWPDEWMWLWGGLTLLVFAQAFRFGTQLQQEKDLTI